MVAANIMWGLFPQPAADFAAMAMRFMEIRKRV
jgi:hypothetical protein